MNYLTALFQLSRREYFADFFITPPLTLVLLVWSLTHSFNVMWPIAFSAGFVLWTLYEYLTHRWVLHRTWLFKAVHDLHHDNQRDYIALHPVVTLGGYVGFAIIFGINSSALMVGFSTGYVVYAALHTAFHYAKIGPGHVLFKLKRHHALHHTIHEANYGVTTTLWDRYFGTLRA